MRYKVKIQPEALTDIQEIINWYNQQKVGLGERFHQTVISQIDSLIKTPHFFINEESQTVEVLAVISTFRNPKIWLEKSGKKQ